MTKIDNGQAKLTYGYDDAGRLASETSDLSALVRGLDSQTVSYNYDELGRSAGLKYPDRTQISYSYDTQGRLTVIDTDDAAPSGSHRTPLATYAYDSLGRIAQLSRDNGVVTTYGYDAASQLLEIMNLLGRTTLASSKYTLDAAGRRTAQTREDGITEKYGYDATSQLTSVDYGAVGPTAGRASSEAFSYDPVGNRTQVGRVVPNAPSVTESYTTNNLNQYTKVASAAFAYDANGNLNSDGQQTYRYDAQNRLIAVENAQTHLDLFYDARNRCVLRKQYTKGSQSQWVLDDKASQALTYDLAWKLLVERQLDGSQTGLYVHGLRTDEILTAQLGLGTRNSKPQTYYPLADALGSTMALVDDRGTVTQRYRYTAFGTPAVLTLDSKLSTLSLSAYRFLFTGREWLSSVQLNDHRNRFYSPNLGRWPSIDPIEFDGGQNLYAYVLNDLISHSDALGLLRDCEQEQIDCFRNCWNSCPPWPIRKGSAGHYGYCSTTCLAAYMECRAANAAVQAANALAAATRQAAEWIAQHQEVVVGTIVVIGGVAFIAVTGGTGAVVLVAL